MIFRRKKGQAAMEFLMTYGWAILIAIIAIAALIAFGVLNPPTQDTCGSAGILIQGVNCNSVKAIAGSGEITFSLTNNLDKAIYILNRAAGRIQFKILGPGSVVTLLGAEGEGVNGVLTLLSGETKEITITDTTTNIIPNQAGKALKGDLTFKYCYTTKSNGLDPPSTICDSPTYDATVRIVQKIASS